VAFRLAKQIQLLGPVKNLFDTPECCAAATYRLFKGAFSVVILTLQHKEAAMGLTHSLNVLMIGAAFLFVATMIFI
jgi:hypothetical protein